jgi:transcriptional regulator with GAF, ATPase, and Fis domain
MDNLVKAQKDFTAAPKTLETVERDHIVRVFEQTQWKVSGKNSAAEIFGLNRTPCALVWVNLTFKNYKFSSQFQSALIICHP